MQFTKPYNSQWHETIIYNGDWRILNNRSTSLNDIIKSQATSFSKEEED